MKTIVFIPPNGILKKQDFSLERIASSLEKVQGVQTILLYIDSNQNKKNVNKFTISIQVKTQSELFDKLSEINYNAIFNRSWMNAYSFSAKLVEKFDNVIVNIKDWNFATKKEYKFLFGNDDDFEAISYIFKNAMYVLSHYTDEQSVIWAQKYDTNKDKFIFFPEYCDNLNIKTIDKKDKNSIVFAGTFSSTATPRFFYVSTDMYDTIGIVTKQNLYLDYILPPKFYDNIDRLLYQDFLYENEFNEFFKLKRGVELDPSILKNYSYAVFSPIINECRNEELFKYAIPSKFAFYLEANIPMIVNEKMLSLSRMVKEKGLGIVVSNNDMKNIKKILENSNHEEFVNNIIKFKNEFTYNSNSLMSLCCS